MRGNDYEVISRALKWAAGGHKSTLVTVLTSYGGSPRPIGANNSSIDRGRTDPVITALA
jgi:xanthine/CO dehydrogenase XdhC/CoxF family maturation factor